MLTLIAPQQPKSLLYHTYSTKEELDIGWEALLGCNTPPAGSGCTVYLPEMSPHNNLYITLLTTYSFKYKIKLKELE